MRNVIASAVVLVLLAMSAVAQDPPARPSRLLTDNAGILAKAEVDEVERSLSRLSRYGLAQAVVYIDKKAPAGVQLQPYTAQVASAWGIGSAEKAVGVVLFIYMDPLQMRIETGKGLQEVLTNDVTQSIVDNELRPAFRREQYAFGLIRAIDSIARTLDMGREMKEREAREKVLEEQRKQRQQEREQQKKKQ